MKSKLDIQRGPSSLEISYPWRGGGVDWFLLFFATLWNLFIFGALIAGAGWFITLHLLVGIGLAYYVAAKFLNRTHIRVSSSQVNIEHGPVPVPFNTNRSVPSRNIEQLYLRKAGTQKKGTRRQTLYRLAIRLKDGKEHAIGLPTTDTDHLQQLERTIEDYLGITDQPQDLADDTPQLDLDALKQALPEPLRRRMDNLRRQYEQDDGPIGELFNQGGSAGAPLPVDLPEDSDELAVQPDGAAVSFLSVPHRIARSAWLDWNDKSNPHARQLELRPLAGGEPRYLYAHQDGRHWSYFEERRLDDHEVDTLGFTYRAPSSFENGEDKFYPRDPQHGSRRTAAGSQPVEQHVYFTTRSSVQFRALRPELGEWEVFVMDVTGV